MTDRNDRSRTDLLLIRQVRDSDDKGPLVFHKQQ